MNKFKHLVLSVLIFAPMLVGAQSLDTVRSYACDFEDPTQNLTWHFPNAGGVDHQWCIGSAVNNGGENSMYVSTDKGQTASYSNQSALVVAYADIILRRSSDKYLLSFDWMAAGYTFLDNDGLYVFWMPERDDVGDTIPLTSYATNAIPKQWEKYALPLNVAKGEDFLRGKSTWQAWMSQSTTQADSRLSKGGKHYRLVFAWRSGKDGPVNPAACIDNIIIADARACRPPKKLNIDKHGKDSLIMSWKRDTCCQNYEVGIYSYEDSLWIINETTDTFFVHQEVPEGFCDFYVRTKCQDTLTGDYFYSAKIQASEFIYYPDNHCVDYITMTDDNCYTSKYHKGDPETQAYKTKYVTEDYHFMHEMVDNGSDEIKSRHTHHYSKMETDPRTGGRLKTVPEGELCSSRLGNWDNGGEAERAEFKFYVNAKKNPIMILKYAVVLESPGHDASKKPGDTDLEDPRFTLNILSHGQSIGDCASADFTSSWVKEGWHDTTVNVVDDKGALSTKNVVWKDWTTIGVNLRQYDGQTLTIQLTTYDCSLQAHFGYAYFVLGCSSDDLDLTGESCSGNPVENFRAPNGFKYRWYQKANPDSICSREQEFSIQPIDTFVYGVDVIFPEDSTCYFTLEASSQPHVPESNWTWEYMPKDCQHFVKIKNKADVLHIKMWEEGGVIKRDTSFTQVDTCFWNWGKLPGTSLQPGDSMLIPIDTAGNYPVSLTTTYKNCEAVVLDTIRIPQLDTTSLRIDTLIIEGDSVLFGNVYYRKSGTYQMVTYNYQGCEILNRLKLEVHANIHVECDPSPICYQQTEWVLPYTMTGVRKGTRYSLVFDDPSLALYRHDSVRIPTTGDTLLIALPETLQPNYYPFTFTFHDSLTGTDPKIVDWSEQYRLCVQYPASVMTQRWNDVLSVRNADSIPEHWSFTSYQWYKDDQPIENATGSYLYQALDSTSEYRVLLTRDSVQIFSCAYIPKLQNPLLDMPTVIYRGASIPMRSRGMVRWYNAEGKVVSEQTYNQSSISAPNIQGIYLLQLTQMPATNLPQYQSQVVRILVR